MDVLEFEKSPILGILRGIEPDILEPLLDAIEQSGLKTIEITMNTQGAADLIRRSVRITAGRLCIGAGTVLNSESLKAALDSGATFTVMPSLIEDVMQHCLNSKIPAFPGALTPQEIYRAWCAGAAMVKVFPVKFFGPEYLKEIKGPFNDIKLLACSGVTAENLKDYFKNGASAVSFGASVFRREWLKGRDFKSIKGAIEKYIRAWNS